MAAISISAESWQVLVAFGLYLVGVMAVGVLSHRFLERGSFIKEYFLGNRGLGPWVLALTVAATAVSGGTFMGFPSLIYKNGWVMALWICSYMIAPLTTMALLGKRLNQAARLSGAVTLPDLFRDRFNSPALGLTATVIMLVCLGVNLVAQFKAGGTVLKVAIGIPGDTGYYIGLVIFAATVVAYTTYGGFWAVTWTDVLEGLVMVIGVVTLAVLAVRAVPPFREHTGLAAATLRLEEIDPNLVAPPGPASATAPDGYLPLAGAFSFFVMWSIIGMGQPGGMVRLMAFKDSSSLRRSILLVCGYYVLTYMSLVVIFVCARALMPTEYVGAEGGSEARGEPDDIMPVMVRRVSPHPLLSGFLLAAPYAAIMSTVAAFLLLISSGIVRDIYQRSIYPAAPARRLRVLSIVTTGAVGALVAVAALRPPSFLQYFIVFSTSGMGCAFGIPMALAIYWRRSTRQGVLAGMAGGAATLFAFYVVGWIRNWRLETGWERPYAPLGLDPLVWGLLASLGLTILVSLLTPVDEERARAYFPPAGPPA